MFYEEIYEMKYGELWQSLKIPRSIKKKKIIMANEQTQWENLFSVSELNSWEVFFVETIFF